MEKESIGDRIKRLRKEKRISVIEIANAIGVSRSNFYRYESGEIENLPYKTLIPIANILGVSPAYLLTGNKMPTNNYNLLIEKLTVSLGDTIVFTEEEVEKIVTFSQFIISKRK